MRKISFFAGALLLLGASFSFADDSVTITTYYPAPYGVYKEFETYSNTYLAHTSGNVGIGTSNPLAKLDLRGRIKIVDGTEGNSKVLTSDASGLSRWETPSGAPAQGGHYGSVKIGIYPGSNFYCAGVGVAGGCYPFECSVMSPPGQCNRITIYVSGRPCWGYSASCPSGYSLTPTGYSYNPNIQCESEFYTCVKQ